MLVCGWERTSDVDIEDVVFFDSVIKDLLGVGVDDEDHPLEQESVLATDGIGPRFDSSPRHWLSP